MPGMEMGRRSRGALSQWRRRWFPGMADPQRTRRRLGEFYATREDYHAMTDGSGKETHPHVRLLMEHVRPADLCVEFGCGGGTVLAEVSAKARRAVGIDVAPLALGRARERVRALSNCSLIQSDVGRVPLRDGVADVAYSLEVLEHVWDPLLVLNEMLRVLRPGGLLFMTAPNGFSLDLHLKKSLAARGLDLIGALSVWGRDAIIRRPFYHLEPDLDVTQAYPDCDMISTFYAPRLQRCLEKQGVRVERMETFFFQLANAAQPRDRLRFQRWEDHPFCSGFGDHILCLARSGDGKSCRRGAQ